MSLLAMTDRELAAMALSLWANHIETGSVSLSAQDAARMGKSFNALNAEQIQLVQRLRQLNEKSLSKGIV